MTLSTRRRAWRVKEYVRCNEKKCLEKSAYISADHIQLTEESHRHLTQILGGYRTSVRGDIEVKGSCVRPHKTISLL